MVVDKSFVCLCEDVTVDELRGVIKRGFTDIEDVKRITGIGTGPCQGKQCMQIFRQMLAEEIGTGIDEVPLTTLRPPIVPIPFGQWASDRKGDGEP
jgi:bacterioferritin-associated ferredoxin